MRPELAKDNWNNFRRALTEEDREAFDELANKARVHADTTTSAAFPGPAEGAALYPLRK